MKLNEPRKQKLEPTKMYAGFLVAGKVCTAIQYSYLLHTSKPPWGGTTRERKMKEKKKKKKEVCKSRAEK